jgi:hypothetical protein
MYCDRRGCEVTLRRNDPRLQRLFVLIVEWSQLSCDKTSDCFLVIHELGQIRNITQSQSDFFQMPTVLENSVWVEQLR